MEPSRSRASGLRGFESHSPHQTYTIATVAKESIVNFLLYLKAKGLRESTLIDYSKVIRHLDKNVDVDNPEQVKKFIADKNVLDSTKEKICNNYNCYVKWRGLTWEKPIYQRDTKLPFIPLEKEIDQLISASSGKTSTFLQFIKESGCRPIEAWRTRWSDIDYERNITYINQPAKHSNPRAFKPSSQLISMFNRLPKILAYFS